MNDISVPEQYDLQTAALKVPPHSIEAEQAVLGGLMLDNNAWERVLDQVSDGDFYRHDHRLIFRAIYKLAERNHPFDVVTLSEQLDKEGQLSQTGGLAYLGELAKNTPSVANIKAYAQIIRERATLRVFCIRQQSGSSGMGLGHLLCIPCAQTCSLQML